uniref:Hpc2-related domain-containing protein n=2 Tax=Babesia bovis TaxID=5865 RepID=A7APV8_BABBO|eukprot:XP_001612160.1 hypothetical protein [Babesia bovis T2Bo]
MPVTDELSHQGLLDEKASPSSSQFPGDGAVPGSQNDNKSTKQTKSALNEEDLVEQDLSEEESVHEPFVQRYRPGVSVDVKLKNVWKNHDDGANHHVPMIIDFYEECLRTYRDERLFVYEEGYLMQRKNNAADAAAARVRSRLTNSQLNDTRGDLVLDNEEPCSQQGPVEVTLDDVMWMKDRPNNPLLRCIQSITDRLNIQGLVGDPVSYLKIGGDDMHYDIDDPFIDDRDMFNELQISRDDLMMKKAMEKDFSVWSEDEDDDHVGVLRATDFISQYASQLQLKEETTSSDSENVPLFFHSSGWRHYAQRIPKQFTYIFKELENKYKSFEGDLDNAALRTMVHDLLSAIFLRLTKFSVPRHRKGTSNDAATSDSKEADDDQVASLARYGLDCIGVGKIIGINGRILRWIVASIGEVTNAVSCRDMHKEWIRLVLEHNEGCIVAMRDRMSEKLATRVSQIMLKRGDKVFHKLSENMKTMSKSVLAVRRLMRKYEEAAEAYNNPENAPSQKSEPAVHSVQKVKAVLPETVTPVKHVVPDDTFSASPFEIDHTPFRVGMANISNLGYTSTLDGIETQSGSRVSPGTITLSAGNETSDNCQRDSVNMDSLNDDAEEGSLTVDDLQSYIEGNKSESPRCSDDGSGSECKEVSFVNMMRKWSKWPRVSFLYSLYKHIALDILTWVQMINLATATQISISNTDFKEMVASELSVPYIFDKAYMRISDLFSTVIFQTTGVKLSIGADISRIVVMYLHETSCIFDLYERASDQKLVFYNNSDVSASEGVLTLTGGKKRKSGSKEKPSKSTVSQENTTQVDETKPAKTKSNRSRKKKITVEITENNPQ